MVALTADPARQGPGGRTIPRELVQTVKGEVAIDRTLRQNGCAALQARVTATVIEQAETLSAGCAPA